MSTQTPVPQNHPLMIAWNVYKATDDYQNTHRWAVHAQHTEGSLWGAFEQGWRAATAAPPRVFVDADLNEELLNALSAEPHGIIQVRNPASIHFLPPPEAAIVVSERAVKRAAKAIWDTWQEHKRSDASWEDAELASAMPHKFPALYEAHALAIDEARAALLAAASTPPESDDDLPPEETAIARCEACGMHVQEGEPYLHGPDTDLCGACAPTFQALVDEPEGFVNADGDPLTPEQCREWFDRHIAGGGQPTDSMAKVDIAHAPVMDFMTPDLRAALDDYWDLALDHGREQQKTHDSLRRSIDAVLAPDQHPESWEAQAKQATSVIGMIRAMIGEMFGPIANLESEEATLLRGPESKHDGEAILAALSRIRDHIATPAPESHLRVTDAMRQAACRALTERGQGNAVTIADVNAMLSAALSSNSEEKYLVWSNEHKCWWGPNHAGYVSRLADAGRYTREDAIKICVKARGGRQFNSNPSEVPLLLADAEVFWPDDKEEWRIERFKHDHPESWEDEE